MDIVGKISMPFFGLFTYHRNIVDEKTAAKEASGPQEDNQFPFSIFGMQLGEWSAEKINEQKAKDVQIAEIPPRKSVRPLDLKQVPESISAESEIKKQYGCY
jgi:hypothetical protein